MANKKSSGKTGKRTLVLTIITILVVAAAVAALVLRFGGFMQGDANSNSPAVDPNAATDYIQIDIENYGTIIAELYGNEAPITVANFMKLVDEGFYDGLTFHRIITGFMIQGGDPLGSGMGGSQDKIKGEFAANGISNDIKHERGVLSMARSLAYDSASSQFFIMHDLATHLDGQYAAFGRVLSGIEVVDAICAGTPVQDRNGTVLAANQPVITSIKRIEKPAE